MPAGSITAGPKSVTRAMGAANLRRGTKPVPIRHHFDDCESAAGTCFAC